MKGSISKAQFTEAVYRNYHGETITSIAKDFGISQPTLSQIKSRNEADWKRIEEHITVTQIVKLVLEKKQE